MRRIKERGRWRQEEREKGRERERRNSPMWPVAILVPTHPSLLS
jgi:hypothetical protein